MNPGDTVFVVNDPDTNKKYLHRIIENVFDRHMDNIKQLHPDRTRFGKKIYHGMDGLYN